LLVHRSDLALQRFALAAFRSGPLEAAPSVHGLTANESDHPSVLLRTESILCKTANEHHNYIIYEKFTRSRSVSAVGAVGGAGAETACKHRIRKRQIRDAHFV